MWQRSWDTFWFFQPTSLPPIPFYNVVFHNWRWWYLSTWANFCQLLLQSIAVSYILCSWKSVKDLITVQWLAKKLKPILMSSALHYGRGFNKIFNKRTSGYDIWAENPQGPKLGGSGGMHPGKIWNSTLVEMGFPAIWTTKSAPLSCLQEIIVDN